jgi:hypothetical protein
MDTRLKTRRHRVVRGVQSLAATTMLLAFTQAARAHDDDEWYRPREHDWHYGWHHDWHSGLHVGWHSGLHWDPYCGWHYGEHYHPHAGRHDDWHCGAHHDWHGGYSDDYVVAMAPSIRRERHLQKACEPNRRDECRYANPFREPLRS